MKTIRELFDPAKKIDRRIEKVITYNLADSRQLKSEIDEYVVTDSITHSFDFLLDQFERGMEGDPSREVGVWVSGFYGSGKSSFTKYLGFALDDSIIIDGQPFLKLLQNQVTSLPLRTRLAAVANRFPATVIMLDLASDQQAGASMVEISSVLYFKVLQWAGYAKDKKVACLESMLERDGKLHQFKEKIKLISGNISWEDMRNQPLMIKTKASQLAPEFYPHIWNTSKQFNDIKIEEMIPEKERVKEMIDILRRRGGKDNIILILDEVGQYVSSRDDLILNLDGLAKNIKANGQGKVWIIATAQQTLTEDDPRAIMNSAKLFKLKDRFPIQVELEAKDIKEICWRRLLGKSSAGELLLNSLYDKDGDKLRYATQLKNTRFYKSELDKQQFRQLYPFLPHHFDILLELLGRLSRTSGGIGLRSAIKVIQDILVDQAGLRPGAELLADKPIGLLATTTDIFDTLRRDILRSYKHLAEAVEKVERVFPAGRLHIETAKTIAVLQILENFPVSAENIAALMHPAVQAQPLAQDIKKAAADLLNAPEIPLSEVDGNLRFMSEAVSEIEKARKAITPYTADWKQIFCEALGNLFSPLPNALIHGNKRVACGVKAHFNAIPVSLDGDKEPIQLLIDYFNPEQYENKKQEALLESQQKTNTANIYLVGREEKKSEEIIVDIYRCRHIYRAYQHKTPDKEVADYLKAQDQQAKKRLKELQDLLEKALIAGSFIFRGKPRPAAELADNIPDAAKKLLSEVAAEVYEKYSEAPVQVQAAAAEKFLKTEKLNRISSEIDPLHLVDRHGQINLENKVFISLKDYLEKFGQVEGRKLLDDFFAPPYGWQKDTTRYIAAAMLVGGAIKLRISGENITVRGDAALQALAKTNDFNKIGIALRDSAPGIHIKKNACDRLRDLLGLEVLPLEEDISKHVIKHFPDIQHELAALPIQLKNLNLPGVDKANNILTDIAEILKGDASDATNRLGGKECSLYDNVLWAREVKKAFKNGLETLVQNISKTNGDIAALPDTGIFSYLKDNSRDITRELNEYTQRENFFDYLTHMQRRLHELNLIIAHTVEEFSREQELSILQKIDALKAKPDWARLDTPEQINISTQLDALIISVGKDTDGLKKLVNHLYTVETTFENCETQIQRIISLQENTPNREKLDFKEWDFEPLPSEITSQSEIDEIIQHLEEIKHQLQTYKKIKINWRV